MKDPSIFRPENTTLDTKLLVEDLTMEDLNFRGEATPRELKTSKISKDYYKHQQDDYRSSKSKSNCVTEGNDSKFEERLLSNPQDTYQEKKSRYDAYRIEIATDDAFHYQLEPQPKEKISRPENHLSNLHC